MWRPGPAHDRAVGEQPPRGGRAIEAVEQPFALLLAELRPRGVEHLRSADRLIAPAAGIDQEQVSQLAERHTPEDTIQLVRIRQPVGEPLAPCLKSGSSPILPWSVALRLVLV